MKRRLEIGIVGCGIAGTATALMLARSGHAVTLFEQTDKVGPVGAGVLLQPSGQRVLREMGLLDELARTSERIEEIHAQTETGRDLVRLCYADRAAGLHGMGLHRGDLFSLMHGKLESAGVTLLLGTRIVSAKQIDTGPTAVDSAGRSHGPFDLLIAADGSRSLLRHACGLTAKVVEYDYGALWTVGDVAPVRGQLYQCARGTKELGGILPIGGGRCSLFWGLHRKLADTTMRRGFARWREDVLRLMPHAQPLIDRIGSMDATRFVSYRRVHTRNVWRGRVVAIGDAAHAMSPHLGQGVNLALDDAKRLAEAIEQCPTPQAAMLQYARRRAWAIRYYATVTAGLSPFFQGDGSLLGRARNFGLPIMNRLGPTRQLMLRTLCGVG